LHLDARGLAPQELPCRIEAWQTTRVDVPLEPAGDGNAHDD